MRKLPNESIHLIITSPPYNIGKEYEKRTTNEIYIEQQAATIAEAVRLLHPRGSICWQVGNGIEEGEVFPLDILLYPKFKDHGLKLRNRIVWTFGHGLHCQKRLSGRHETILWFTKDAVESLIEASLTSIEVAKGQKDSEAALKALSEANSKLVSVDLTRAGVGTYVGIRKQLEAIESLAGKLKAKLTDLESGGG
ncbi:DNA methyltransferase [Bradyrhizobium shewense]|nr:DNA methyltransferase [Bradyrhizobium shewense]